MQHKTCVPATWSKVVANCYRKRSDTYEITLYLRKTTRICNCYSAGERNKIINLCFRVQGKTDRTPQNLILWAYDDCPTLCPVRHLMSYVHVCEIKDGFLFPNLKNRSEPRTYDSVMNVLNTRFKEILHIVWRNSPLSTHTFRKTACNMGGGWGGSSNGTSVCEAQIGLDGTAIRRVFPFLTRNVNGERSQRKLSSGTLQNGNHHSSGECTVISEMPSRIADTSNLTEGARSFVNTVVLPIL
jgi:hypothetical protein